MSQKNLQSVGCLRFAQPAEAGSQSIGRAAHGAIRFRQEHRIQSSVRAFSSWVLLLSASSKCSASFTARGFQQGRSSRSPLSPLQNNLYSRSGRIARYSEAQALRVFSVRSVGSCSPPRMSRTQQAASNPSLNLTRYGTQRKPGTLPLRHHRVPGLRCAPPRAG